MSVVSGTLALQWSAALSPFTSLSSALAPCLISVVHTLPDPACAALKRGVSPLTSTALGLALLFRRYSQIILCPPAHAWCREVMFLSSLRYTDAPLSTRDMTLSALPLRLASSTSHPIIVSSLPLSDRFRIDTRLTAILLAPSLAYRSPPCLISRTMGSPCPASAAAIKGVCRPGSLRTSTVAPAPTSTSIISQRLFCAALCSAANPCPSSASRRQPLAPATASMRSMSLGCERTATRRHVSPPGTRGSSARSSCDSIALIGFSSPLETAARSCLKRSLFIWAASFSSSDNWDARRASSSLACFSSAS
mmetsp:Transcript_56137/g.135797  ORF Transcript_56137/g.135797 Transcript_56137/m.135797 type:complete len:308 (+) Transcript_56137:246-1169(+)